ncbi:MAG: hypothetical protein WAQ25_01635 [Candidatus Saccharimonas sp.]
MHDMQVVIISYQSLLALECAGVALSEVEHIICATILPSQTVALRDALASSEAFGQDYLALADGQVFAVVNSLEVDGLKAANYVRGDLLGLPSQAHTWVKPTSSQAGLASFADN